MTLERRNKIVASLERGNWIYRRWPGGNAGYLKHSLEGILRLRESEVNELYKAGIIEIVSSNEFKLKHGTWSGSFRPLKLKWTPKDEGIRGVNAG